MDLRLLVTVFVTVFLAELGDKTQLATMLFAANKDVSKLTIFFGASIALIISSAIGIAAGSVITQWVNPRVLHIAAGVGFIVMGIWTLIKI